MGVMRPGGRVRPNEIAKSRGLVFALDFANPEAEPWIRDRDTGVVPGSFGNGGDRVTSKAGWGLGGTNGYWQAASGVTWSVPTTAGTIIGAATPSFASNSATSHYLFSQANNYPSGPGVEVLKYNDGNCYFGIISGGDKRVIFSNVGLWDPGEFLTMGTSWGASGQTAWVKGRAVASNASTGLSATNGTPFTVGHLHPNTGSNESWDKTGDASIQYLLIFDRELSAAEWAEAEVDKWWWIETMPGIGHNGGPPLATPFYQSIISG